MLLIADSGSTKTEWILLNNGIVERSFLTSGFNPYYFGKNEIRQILTTELPHDLAYEAIDNVYYYGSGCSTPTNCRIVSDAFELLFTKAEIAIHHDLLAAAHALLGHEAGIACILGTGSNSCYYDGKQIVENVPSLGYMLGDEGSANNIGKKLLAAVLSGKAPKKIIKEFYGTYKLNFETALRKLYEHEKPGLFLAEFSSFAGKHIEYPFCRDLVAAAFDDFIEVQLKQYSRYRELPVGFVGSVAWHSRDILQQQLANAGIMMGRVMKSPIEGLVVYYKGQ